MGAQGTHQECMVWAELFGETAWSTSRSSLPPTFPLFRYSSVILETKVAQQNLPLPNGASSTYANLGSTAAHDHDAKHARVAARVCKSVLICFDIVLMVSLVLSLALSGGAWQGSKKIVHSRLLPSSYAVLPLPAFADMH